MSECLVRVVGVEVRYGERVAIHDVTLTVAPGQLLAVTGPSGAGKTSLLWAMAGALTPSAGQVFLDGDLVTGRAESAVRGLAIIPQGNALVSTLTARENVVVPLLAADAPAAEAGVRATAALVAVGLDEWGDHLVEELSGGQQQRVAVARGLATRARVLLADEPTSDLDGGNRGRIMAAFRTAAEAGAAVVVSTHDAAAAVEADGELALDEGMATWVRPLGGAERASADLGLPAAADPAGTPGRHRRPGRGSRRDRWRSE